MVKEDINKKLQRIIKEAQEIKIPVPDNISAEVNINSRPKKRFGCCKKSGGYFVIEISRFILECDEKAVDSVIAHEVLHTCKDSYNHGSTWKQNAEKMNRTYGYNIKRVSSFAEMGVTESAAAGDIRYIIKCRKCGKEYPRQKYTCVMKKINAYRCSCGGRLYVIDLCGGRQL